MQQDDPFTRLNDRAEAFAARQASSLADHPVRTTLRWTACIVVVCLLISLVGALVANATGIASIFWSAEAAKLTAKPRVTRQIYQTQNIIAEVALFHNKCVAVRKDLAIFVNNEARYQSDLQIAHLQTDPLQQQAAITELSSAQQDATAALDVAQQDAADYNSASAQYTQAPFKDRGLPYRIDLPAGSAAAARFNLNCQ